MFSKASKLQNGEIHFFPILRQLKKVGWKATFLNTLNNTCKGPIFLIHRYRSHLSSIKIEYFSFRKNSLHEWLVSRVARELFRILSSDCLFRSLPFSSFTPLKVRYVFALRATQVLLFLCCVAIRAKTYLAPSGVNEWGFILSERSELLLHQNKREAYFEYLSHFYLRYQSNMAKVFLTTLFLVSLARIHGDPLPHYHTKEIRSIGKDILSMVDDTSSLIGQVINQLNTACWIMLNIRAQVNFRTFCN